MKVVGLKLVLQLGHALSADVRGNSKEEVLNFNFETSFNWATR